MITLQCQQHIETVVGYIDYVTASQRNLTNTIKHDKEEIIFNEHTVLQYYRELSTSRIDDALSLIVFESTTFKPQNKLQN